MTPKDIFYMALDIMNERKQDGKYSKDIGDYQGNVISYLNILTVSLYDLDCKIKGVPCFFDQDTPPLITSLDQVLDTHISICRGVLPYGLAFMLLMEEEPSRSETLRSLYESAAYKIERLYTRSKRLKIKEVY